VAADIAPVVGIAVFIFRTWVGVGIDVRGDTGSRATIVATTYAITVSMVSYSCVIRLT
jgi:Cu2+-exporting ATPase